MGYNDLIINRMSTAAGQADAIRENITRLQAFISTDRMVNPAARNRAEKTIAELQDQLRTFLANREPVA